MTTFSLEFDDGDSSSTECENIEDAWKEVEEWANNDIECDDGAAIGVSIIPEDDDGNLLEDQREYTVIEVEPNHPKLIRAAVDALDDVCGYNPDDHDWVIGDTWTNGGTAMIFGSHCRKCGLIREEHKTGEQRNPGEHDTVKYSMPEADEKTPKDYNQ